MSQARRVPPAGWEDMISATRLQRSVLRLVFARPITSTKTLSPATPSEEAATGTHGCQDEQQDHHDSETTDKPSAHDDLRQSWCQLSDLICTVRSGTGASKSFIATLVRRSAEFVWIISHSLPEGKRISGSSEMSLVSAVMNTRQQLCQSDGVERLHNGKLVFSWFRGVGTLESVVPQARQGRSVCRNVVHTSCMSLANQTPIRNA